MLDEMYKALRIVVAHEKAFALNTESKVQSRMWPLHLLYLMHMTPASGSSEQIIVDNIVNTPYHT